MKIYLILILFTILGSFASLFFKKSSKEKNLLKMLKNKNIYIGATLYIVAAVLNIIVLKELDYSIVLPLTSITYIWTLFISKKYLDENINKGKILGLIFILIGAILITR